MTLKEFAKRTTIKPFPWRCPRCLKDAVRPATITYTANLPHHGKIQAVEIPQLRIPKCQECGELLFTNCVDAQIDRAFRAQQSLGADSANETAVRSAGPPIECAKVMRRLQELVRRRNDESDEGDALRDDMGILWYALTEPEQQRMGGLSEDLYALAEGGPPRVAMSESEMARWQNEAKNILEKLEQGDADAPLAFLRKPIPDAIALGAIHMLQAECWDKLGDPDTAAVFRAAAQQQPANGALEPLSLAALQAHLTAPTHAVP